MFYSQHPESSLHTRKPQYETYLSAEYLGITIKYAGIKKQWSLIELFFRITAAYAGTNYFIFYLLRSTGDHPRIRGDHKLIR